MNSKVLRGVVRGNIIELLDDSGLSDGNHVEIVVRAVIQKGKRRATGFCERRER